jgi:hypothetical protein
MYGTWHPIALSTSGKLPGEKYKNRIQIIFDTNNDGVPDYIGVILFQGHLKMIVRGQGSTFKPIKVTRPDHKTALVEIPIGSTFNPTHRFQLATKSVVFGYEGKPKKVDRAPDSGWIVIPHA